MPGTFPVLFFNVLVGQKTVPELNSLIVVRLGAVPDTDNSTVPNTLSGSVPRAAALLVVPSAGAAGNPGSSEGHLTWAWEGSSAHLDGQVVTAHWGLKTTSSGTHEREVDSQTEVQASLSIATPTASFIATPPVISSG